MTALRIYPEELVPKPGARERIRRVEVCRAAELARAKGRRIPIRTDEDIAVAINNHALVVAFAAAAIMAAPKPFEGAAASRRILREVCEKHAVEIGAVMGPRRRLALVIARQEAMYRLYSERKHMSLPNIGRLLGKDHTTVLHGIRRHLERNGLPFLGQGLRNSTPVKRAEEDMAVMG